MTRCERDTPDVLFVNGPSSAGKSSLITAVLHLSAVPYLHVGLDHFFASVPDQWGGGLPGRYAREGFAYQPCQTSSDDLPCTAITVGTTGSKMYAAYRRSLVTLLEQGCRLAIDELLLSPEIGADYDELLSPYDVQCVLMTAGPDCLEERGRARNNPPGLGRWPVSAALHLAREYDITLDSERTSTQECASAVAESWGLIA